MHLPILFTALLTLLISLATSSPLVGDPYEEVKVNPDCGKPEQGAKYQQVGSMLWGVPGPYNTTVCLLPQSNDGMKLQNGDVHEVNRFFLASGFYISAYSDEHCRKGKNQVKGVSGTLFGEYKIHSCMAWQYGVEKYPEEEPEPTSSSTA